MLTYTLDGCMLDISLNVPFIVHIVILLLFRVVEIHRICEATATPHKEGANLSEKHCRMADRTIRGFDEWLSGPLI